MYNQFRWTNVSARRNGLTREYEPLQPFFLFDVAEKVGCRTFIDVGANVGVYSLFSTLVPTIERIIAFEASPETMRELRSNIALNGLDDAIEVHGTAVSNSSGTLAFGVASRFSGANSVIDTSIHSRSIFHEEIAVEASTLDQALGDVASGPFCIKVDVEGHEGAVIDGAVSVLSANKAIVQLEAYDDADRSVFSKLAELGYRRLTALGPDQYFSNIEELNDPANVIEAYEKAVKRLIDYNHRSKIITLKRGDFAFQLSGRSAAIASSLVKRLIGWRL